MSFHYLAFNVEYLESMERLLHIYIYIYIYVLSTDSTANLPTISNVYQIYII